MIEAIHLQDPAPGGGQQRIWRPFRVGTRLYHRRMQCRARVWGGRLSAAYPPALMLVMKERGTIRLMGIDLTPVCPGSTLAWGVSGIRQAVVVQ